MNNWKKIGMSRREFARRAALASAAASFASVNALGVDSLPAQLPQGQATDLPKLSPESQAEVDSRIQAIFAQYGSRLSEEQKADIRRLATVAQPQLDRLRAYATDNGDNPALYLKPLLERENKPSPMMPQAPKPNDTAKKP